MKAVNPTTHVQSVASDSWVISHGFSSHPGVSVSVYENGVLTAILPMAIEFPNATTVKVTFSSPRTGEARLS